MGYPVSYRRGAKVYRTTGLSNVAKPSGRALPRPFVIIDFGGVVPPTPAPSTEGLRPALSLRELAPVAGVGSNVLKTTWLSLGVRGLSRLVPLLNIALLLWDLYNLYQWWSQRRNTEGWELLVECPVGGSTDLTPGNAGLCGINPAHQNPWAEPANQYTDFERLPNSFGHENWRGLRSYHRIIEDAPPYWPPLPLSDIAPVPASNPWPALDPDAVPVSAWEPLPLPIPYRLIPYRQPNPYRVYQPERGYGSVPRGYPSVQTHMDPVDGPRHTHHPYWPTRPPKRTKERKMRMMLNGTWIGLVINTVTEMLDFINALWKSLPKRYQSRYANVYDKLYDLWKHGEHINGAEAMLQLLWETLEDRTYGQFTPDQLPWWVSPRGPGLFPSVQPDFPSGLPRNDPWDVPEIVSVRDFGEKGT